MIAVMAIVYVRDESVVVWIVIVCPYECVVLARVVKAVAS
jgi:hypothetical protein